jgi:retron-type reverse transcriptase
MRGAPDAYYSGASDPDHQSVQRVVLAAPGPETVRKVNHILDADIRSFFDEVSQERLVRFLEHRIGDQRIIRLILKWLRAGVLEDGIVTVSDTGTGQGSVISPLLANIYLHYVFDLWAGGTACVRSFGRLRTNCDGECISRSPSKSDG